MPMRILAVGCSFANGHGLNGVSDPNLWVNQVARECFGRDVCVTNLAQSGKDNNWIFTEAACELTQGQPYDLAIVAWTALPRVTAQVGLELYSTDTIFKNSDVHINPNVTVSGKWLEETGKRRLRYYNDHWAILQLVKYVNILVNISKGVNNTKIVFVNSLMDIPENFFDGAPPKYPIELSKFEQTMFQTDTRDDSEVWALYNMVHSAYTKYGGIHESLWLNLYHSLQHKKIDTVSLDDWHPGYASQDLYASQMIPKMVELLGSKV